MYTVLIMYKHLITVTQAAVVVAVEMGLMLFCQGIACGKWGFTGLCGSVILSRHCRVEAARADASAARADASADGVYKH